LPNYTKKVNCRICHSPNLKQILDLNNQPLANNYHKGEDQETFPLELNVCESCFHLQLSVVVNPDLMFKNYLYVSGTSKTLHNYFVDFVDTCESYRIGNKKVLDIACNDGTQLDKFKNKGWETFGVDPAENLYKLSSKNHKITCEYWNQDIASKMDEIFDVIIAQNVFAHVDDVHEFLKSCAHVMDKDSCLFIQTSQANMIINNEFDTIYHEHLSFFNSNSMKRCANINNFSLVDVFKTDIHGGSYVFVLKKGSATESKAIAEINKEKEKGLYKLNTYIKYAEKCRSITVSLNKKIDEFRAKGYKIIGYGAAAKGNTFLNFGLIDLDYIVDDNELKWDLYTPGRNILIKDPQALKNEDPQNIIIIPLAWNFFTEIGNKTREITESDVIFIKYFPEVEVI